MIERCSREGWREMSREVPREGERGESERGRGERRERRRERRGERLRQLIFGCCQTGLLFYYFLVKQPIYNIVMIWVLKSFLFVNKPSH